jgi:hypothetical protein
MRRFAWLSMAAFGLPCCAQRDEAQELRQQLEDDDYRRSYARAPGWDAERQPSEGGPHGDFVDIYVNDVVEQAFASGEALDAWPEGSIIVKDGWSSDGDASLLPCSPMSTWRRRGFVKAVVASAAVPLPGDRSSRSVLDADARGPKARLETRVSKTRCDRRAVPSA